MTAERWPNIDDATITNADMTKLTARSVAIDTVEIDLVRISSVVYRDGKMVIHITDPEETR